MNLIETAIKYVSPGWALRRVRQRQYLNYYEAAEPSQYRKKRRDRGSGDASVAKAGDKLRVLARDLDQNHDLAHGALNTLVNNIVGEGIRYEPMVRHINGDLHDEVNEQLMELHKDFSKCPDVTWEHNLGALERLACRTWLRDGETFAIYHQGFSRTLNHGTKVPLSIELLEADMVPLHYNDHKRRIVQGVEKNDWGRPVAFHVYKHHPGDVFSAKTETKRISAEFVNQLKVTDRIRQTRGVSILAVVLIRLDDLKDFEDSERIAARINAKMVGYIKKGTPDMYGEMQQDRQSFEKGMMFYDMAPGEDIGTIDTNRPNSGLEKFRSGQLKAAAAGLSAGYSSISRDYNGTYAAQRQELVDQYINYAVIRNLFAHRFSRPIYERFVRMSLTSNLLDLPSDVDMESIYDVICSGPPMSWIDPVKDASANVMLIKHGFKSISQVVREYGGSPRDVFAQIKRDQKILSQKELLFILSNLTNKGAEFIDQEENVYVQPE